MFEFLEKCDRQLFNNTLELESQMRTRYAFVSMRKICEYILKEMYDDFQKKSCNRWLPKLDKYNELIDNQDLRDYLQREFSFRNFEVLNRIRTLGNGVAHIGKQQVWTDQGTLQQFFFCTYDLCRCYYKYKTNKEAPAWSETEYKKVLDNALDPDARKKAELKYAGKIRAAESEKEEAHHAAIQKEQEVQRLEEMLAKVKKESLEPEVLAEYESKIQRLTDEKNSIEATNIRLAREISDSENSRQEAQRKLDQIKLELSRKKGMEREFQQQLQAEQERYQKLVESHSSQADALKISNQKLLEKLQSIQDERNNLEKQLEMRELQAVDADTYRTLTEQLAQAQTAQKQAQDKLAEYEKKYQELDNKLFLSRAQTDDVYQDYLKAKEENDSLALEQQQLREDIKDIEATISDNGPICPLCKAPLRPRHSKDGSSQFWGCSSWRPNNEGCSFTRKVEPNEQETYNRIAELYGQKNTEWAQINDIAGRQKAIFGRRFRLDSERLERLKKRYIVFSQYPDSIDYNGSHSFWFESLTVPKQLFEKRDALGLSKYSRFMIRTELPAKGIPLKHRTIFSLALKLLNRGIVLQSCEKTSSKLMEKFSSTGIGSLNSLFDYVNYESPWLGYSNDYEREFAENVFPQLFGKSWTSYVQVHVGLDVLLPEEVDEWNRLAGQDADFVFYRDDKKVVVYLNDGKRNLNVRKSILKNYGYSVFEYTNGVSKSELSGIIQELQSALGGMPSAAVTEVGDRFSVACKLTHQIQIAVAKSLEQGIITGDNNLRFTCNTDLFEQSEIDYIVAVALDELSDIIQQYAYLYDCDDLSLDFSDKSKPIVSIDIGNGTDAQILIRDLFVPYNYLCPIEAFETEIMPQNIEISSLKFFLKYLFDFNDFRDGQIEAIRRLLRRKDSIVLLPTGAGKSVIYQLASYIFPGMIVVISPLNSLIEDQIENLSNRYGINNVVSISSENSAREVQKQVVAALMSHNSTSLLYISPERLQIPNFRNRIADLLSKNNVCAIAIDEAHCVSEWGHEFRPAYLNIGTTARTLFKKNNYVPSILALTGTASDAVLSDVQRDLNITNNDALILPSTFDRSELSFDIVPCSAYQKTFKIASLIKTDLPRAFGKNFKDFARRCGEDTCSGVIFTPLAAPRTPSEYDAASLSERLQGMLPELGIGSYYSSVPNGYDEESWKTTVRDFAKRFKDNELNLIVATKAYGMGIDKSNIRFTIHDGIPTSIEQYYQEAGRAGRDRRDSKCILLFSNDHDELNKKILNPALTVKELVECYNNEYKTSTKNSGRDDLSSALFFHIESFAGIDNECSVLMSIIDTIMEGNPHPNSNMTQPLLPKKGQTKNEAEREWIRALIRLDTLGIITDYTYDYAGTFELTFGSFDKESIIRYYRRYVSIYQKEKAKAEVEKLQKSTESGWDFIKYAVRVLVEYIYDTIEKSRRAALREMFLLAKDAVTLPEEQRNVFIKKRILQYLALADREKDLLGAIRDGNNGGFPNISDVITFHLSCVNETDEEADYADKLKGSIGRIIESNADHPGLLLLRALLEIKSGHYNESLVCNDIEAAFTFAIERYSVKASVCTEMLIKTLNLLLNESTDLYSEVKERLEKRGLFEFAPIEVNMLSSEYVGDNNRDKIMLDYLSRELKERL